MDRDAVDYATGYYPKVNGVISVDYDLSSVPVATVFVAFFYFRSIFNITGGARILGKTKLECQEGQFLKKCSGCFIPTHTNLIGGCYDEKN